MEHDDHVPLYDHDIVAPLITKETDIPSAAVRKALLEKRTTERCKKYLLTRKRTRNGSNVRKPRTSNNPHDGNGATTSLQESQKCFTSRAALPKARVAKKQKKSNDDEEEEEEEEESSTQEEGELEIEQRAEGEDSSEDGYDLSNYQYLIEKPHYDPDDEAVYKCSVIDVDDNGDIVVFRCKYNSESGEWGEVNMDDPIHVAAVVRDEKHFRNFEKMNEILQS